MGSHCLRLLRLSLSLPPSPPLSLPLRFSPPSVCPLIWPCTPLSSQEAGESREGRRAGSHPRGASVDFSQVSSRNREIRKDEQLNIHLSFLQVNRTSLLNTKK